MRCVPGPITVTTGATFTCRTNVGRAPLRPNTKLGRTITYSSPDASTAPLHRPLGAKYGTSSFVCSVVPSALICTKRSTPASFAAASKEAVPSVITCWKSAGFPLRIATRFTTCVQPSTAGASVCGPVRSPATTSARSP